MERMKIAQFLGNLGERKLLSSTLVVFTLAIGIIIGTMISTNVNAAREGKAAAPDAKPLKIPDPVELESEFSKIAKQLRPSVVNIQVEALPRQTAETQAPRERNRADEFFRRFFGMPEGPGDPFGGERERRRRPGEGSGVIVDPNGYIITNYHVIEGADRIRVRLFDDTRNGDKLFDAKLIGSDPETDLAVIKIDAKKTLEPAPIGNSDAVNVGDWAIAVGSPFGYRESVTVGIVSAKGREVREVTPNSFKKFIQTDAAINPGNSGGPLLNLHGEVVGVSSAIYSRSGGYMGIGFAIPIEMFQAIRDDLIRHGTVTRGLLGVAIQDLDAGLARSFGFEGTDGVLVSEVREGSPAARAGLETGDIVVSFAGEPMTDKEELRFRVAETRPGTRVPVEVFRDGDVERVEVVIGELSAADASLGGPEQSESDLGMEVRSLSPDLAVRFGLPSDTSGVVVARVEPAGTAARAGLRSGDVITSIDGRDVASVADFRAALRAADVSDGVRLRVRSAQGRRFVFLQPRR